MQVIFFSFLHCLTFFFGFLPHPIYHLPLTLSSTSLHSPLTSLPIPITPFFPPIPSANPLISSPYPSPIPPLFTLPVTLFQHSLPVTFYYPISPHISFISLLLLLHILLPHPMSATPSPYHPISPQIVTLSIALPSTFPSVIKNYHQQV